MKHSKAVRIKIGVYEVVDGGVNGISWLKTQSAKIEPNSFGDYRGTCEDRHIDLFPSEPHLGVIMICERKFVLLRGSDEICIGIGPPLLPIGYSHSDIPMSFDGDLERAGGGSVTTRYWWVEREGKLVCKSNPIKFHGASGDYGCYDPVLLENKVFDAIWKVFDHEVLFQTGMGNVNSWPSGEALLTHQR